MMAASNHDDARSRHVDLISDLTQVLTVVRAHPEIWGPIERADLHLSAPLELIVQAAAHIHVAPEEHRAGDGFTHVRLRLKTDSALRVFLHATIRTPGTVGVDRPAAELEIAAATAADLYESAGDADADDERREARRRR